ncbi:Calx-beta domain-containing protein [Actinoplanes sp. NPDC026619]|uniref:Calx-beta domain-containing protein n=1 Tax=Actinoplanes sp. NPDC026619 TaxID=3155798 RepID=UPI0033E7DCD5
MRYQEAHAAKSGSVPFTLRGKKLSRTVLATAVAGAIGLVPAVMVPSPAFAVVAGDLTITPNTPSEGSPLTFSVTSSTVAAPTGVTWSTSDGTAKAGSDYNAVTGQTITWGGATTAWTATLSVTTLNDNLYEGPETVNLNIYDTATSTTTAVKTSVGTITDLQTAPTVNITPAAAPEGNSGWHAQTYSVNLSPGMQAATSLRWTAAVGAGTATDGTDFKGATGTLDFASGETSKTFTVDVNGDTSYEGDETFEIALDHFYLAGTTNASAVVAPGGPFTETITDDDAKPTYTISDIKMDEGDGPMAALVEVKLSNPTKSTATFTVSSTDITADSGQFVVTNAPSGVGTNDYGLALTTATVAAGKDTGYGFILINGDSIFEPDETATLSVVPNAGTIAASILGSQAAVNSKLTLVNDDKAPQLEVDNATVDQGGSVALTGTTTGISQSDTPFNLSFMGGGDHPASTSDFMPPANMSPIVPAGTASGSKVQLGTLTASKPSHPQSDKTVIVSGTGFGGATVKEGWVTIKGNAPAVELTLKAPTWSTGGVDVPLSGTAEAGATVDLWAAPISASEPDLMKVASTKADKDGEFWFKRTIMQGYRFKVASGGDTSDEKWVRVTQMPVFSAVSSAKGMVTFTVQGTPKGVGQVVIVQKWVGGKWVNTWKGVTASNGQFKWSGKNASGALTVRAFVQGYTPNGIAGGYSAQKKITVK